MLIEMRQDFAVGDRTADLDRVGAGRDVTQLLDRLESDHRRQRLAILAHAQPKIGAARKQDGASGAAPSPRTAHRASAA